jgi:hypothetical protein
VLDAAADITGLLAADEAGHGFWAASGNSAVITLNVPAAGTYEVSCCTAVVVVAAVLVVALCSSTVSTVQCYSATCVLCCSAYHACSSLLL